MERKRDEDGKVKFILCRLLHNLRRFVNAIVEREKKVLGMDGRCIRCRAFSFNLMVVVQHTMK